MAKVLCLGCPYTPPIIHGHAFEPAGDDVHYFAEIPEADFGKFLIGVPGSPFFLETPAKNLPPSDTGGNQTGSEGPGDEQTGAGNTGEQTGSEGSDEGGEGGDGPGDEAGGNGPGSEVPGVEALMAEFLVPSKAALAALAKERLGLDLDAGRDSKLEAMRAAVRAELERRATL